MRHVRRLVDTLRRIAAPGPTHRSTRPLQYGLLVLGVVIATAAVALLLGGRLDAAFARTSP